jgi:hypothetical protein
VRFALRTELDHRTNRDHVVLDGLVSSFTCAVVDQRVEVGAPRAGAVAVKERCQGHRFALSRTGLAPVSMTLPAHRWLRHSYRPRRVRAALDQLH